MAARGGPGAGIAEAAAGPAEWSRPAASFVVVDGEAYCRLDGVDRMPPFLVNLPTDTDLWMFLSSTGGLTAGRRDPDGAIFPYETVDKLHDAPLHTGPITLVRVRRNGNPARLWEPLAPGDGALRRVERSLVKSVLGNRIAFEEVDPEGQLAFGYRWCGSDPTGWVRTAWLENRGREPAVVSLLDGVRNVLPSGAPLRLYQQSSCLVDAYKRVDLDPATGLGIYSLTAKIGDRPEPAEELRATTVWCHGLPAARACLSLDAVGAFRRGEPRRPERVLTGRRGNYLVASTLELAPGERVVWHIAADAERSHVQIARLRARLRERSGLGVWIEDSLREASDSLRRIVASADGLQVSARPEVGAHHLACVLYNTLRGGVFVHNYSFPAADFAAFLATRSRRVAARHAARLAALPAEPSLADLHRLAAAAGDPDLRRLCLEYLPLYFGRRHGDPSRPWNRFSICVRSPDGSRALRYEGNWRDVFQNWEALALSFPGFLPSLIARFLNASTLDGFNPYRITRDGVDWEVLDPRDPWSGIGYWGDHQLPYLLRLVESMRRHFPGGLEELLDQEIWSYAEVPYRLKPYAELLAHPRSTIGFDDVLQTRIAARVAAEGTDGKLVHAADGSVAHASLLEKLLIPALAKLSSFVPGGGIWMNTERPEWNDAQNALAGHGLSVVTLCHLHRYLGFLEDLLAARPGATAPVSAAVAEWRRQMAGALERHEPIRTTASADDRARRRLLDELGIAFSRYRERVYAGGLEGKSVLAAGEVAAWCRLARAHVEAAIRANRRSDGLYHSYNLLEIGPDGTGAAVLPLGLMLEGQVAALGSGLVGAAEAADLLESLFASPLYREDQASFLLYPETPLPGFLDRNRIPEARAAGLRLVTELLAAEDSSILARDAEGVLRFHGDLASARDVAAALDRLARSEGWAASVARDREAVVGLFEEVFGHRSFTGRAERMYAYEGLGCVYWHMVAKLLLAVQEVTLAARDAGEAPALCQTLARFYFHIRGGLGFAKSARDYGAFPTDPYSHTPAQGGAQQPGMTGQVKEEILTRFGELGVRVREGVVELDPALLRTDEFLVEPGRYDYVDAAGASGSQPVPARGLAFSCCQVPVVYVLTRGESWIRVTVRGGVTRERPGGRLDPEESRALLERRGHITLIERGVPEGSLCPS